MRTRHVFAMQGFHANSTHLAEGLTVYLSHMVCHLEGRMGHGHLRELVYDSLLAIQRLLAVVGQTLCRAKQKTSKENRVLLCDEYGTWFKGRYLKEVPRAARTFPSISMPYASTSSKVVKLGVYVTMFDSSLEFRGVCNNLKGDIPAS